MRRQPITFTTKAGEQGRLFITKRGETCFRAVLSIHGEAERFFGTAHPEARESAGQLLSRLSHRIRAAERNRVLEVIQSDTPPSVVQSATPASVVQSATPPSVLQSDARPSVVQSDTPPRTFGSQPRPASRCVPIIHQIYDLSGERTEMPRICEDTSKCWRQVARRMGAQYHLWSADEVESLIQQRYKDLWLTYNKAAFAEMRVHIARVAIVHCYGGMYAGLDILPQSDTFDSDNAKHRTCTVKYILDRARLAIQIKDKYIGRSLLGEWISCDVLDLAVFIADAGNRFLRDFLDYMQRSIAERSYSNSEVSQGRHHISVRMQRRMQRRYISSTTGQDCANRFWQEQSKQFKLRVVKLRLHEGEAVEAEKPALSPAAGDGQGLVPVLDGSQPSRRIWRRFGCKRKVNPNDFEKNPQPTKKVASDTAGLKEVEPSEKGIVAGLHYLLRSPLKGDDFEEPGKKPLLLFLHGSGERGPLDGTELHKVQKHGPWNCHGADGFFILAPQCPNKCVWPTLVEQVRKLLRYVCDIHDVDKSRVYITGLSMGAFGAWTLAASQPQMFAAIVSVAGGALWGRLATKTSTAEMLRLAHKQDLQSCSKALEPCKNMPAWIFYGTKDNIVLPICSQHIVAILEDDNRHLRVTAYQNVGHDCWDSAYNTLDLYTWLLEHSLP